MKKKKYVWMPGLLVLILILSACGSPAAATPTSEPVATENPLMSPVNTLAPGTQLAVDLPTLAPSSLEPTLPPLVPDCLSPTGYMGQVCMAKNAAGQMLNPGKTVGCTVNGQNYGVASPNGLNAGQPIEEYLNCDAPLYAQAIVFEVKEGTTPRYGPGSYRSAEVPPQIWFDRDGSGGVWNRTLVNVLGCHQDFSRYAQHTLDQYEAAGFGRVDALSINYRVLIEVDGWYTWVWGGSLDGTTDGTEDFSQFNPVCNPYTASASATVGTPTPISTTAP